MTPTPIDPDLQLSLSPMGSPHHPSLNPMPMQLSLPHDHPLPLDHLNQLMSCLSIKTTNNEEVTYVRIPIHPRTLVAWNQMTKTPSLPHWLDSSTHRRHKRNFRGHARARRAVCNLCGLDWLVSGIHVIGFGAEKPRVEVGEFDFFTCTPDSLVSASRELSSLFY